MKKKRVTLFFLRLFSGILVVISSVLILVFIIVFWGTPLSQRMSDWGDFGSYVACIASLINLVFFIVLTHKATEFERASSEKQLRLQKVTFDCQMLSQKVELQTAFRKSHIDDVRNIMFKLNNLTAYRLTNGDEFKTFKRECETLKRIFEIYEMNKNIELVGDCNYTNINNQFELLFQLINSMPNNSVVTDNECNKIWEILNRVNEEIITLDKQLSDYTLEELKKAFEKI